MRGSFFKKLDHRHFLVLAVGWMVFIFVMSHRSTVPLPPTIVGQDKFMHFVAYGILGLFWARGFDRGVFTLTHVGITAAICSLYGVSDEFHQSFVPGREVSAYDWLADTLGGAAGALWHYRFREFTKNSVK